MSLLRKVIKKRSEDQQNTQDAKRLVDFSQRVKKVHGKMGLERHDTSQEPEVALEVVSINIRDIEVPPNYARKAIGDVSALARSIQIYGMQQPIKVVKIRGTKKYRLVFGRRRIKAAQEIGLEAVPCIVELVAQKERLMMLSLAENVNRRKLGPMEEGACYKYLMNQSKLDMKEIEQIYGRSDQYVNGAMSMLVLPDNIKKEVLGDPQKYSWEVLHKLTEVFQSSEAQGRKLFQAIYSGKVSTTKEMDYFLQQN